MEGKETYEHAEKVPPTRFKLMQLGVAAAVPCDRTHPYQTVWEAESTELKEELADKLKAQVRKMRDAVDVRRKNATTPHQCEA
jgi:hypothetical protein